MKRVWVTALILCAISITAGGLVQVQIDQTRTSRERLQEKLIYIPETRFLKAASLGFHAVLADLFWARSVIYFGEHYATDKEYQWLYRILDATTTLDPENVLAYRFGGTLLSLRKEGVEESIALLKKGIEKNPDEDWRLYFLLGYNYFFHLEDYASAAKYMEMASKIPGHPTYLPRLAARMYAKSGNEETALAFLKEAYNQYEDETVKAAIADRINRLVAKMQLKPLQNVAEKYKEDYGRYPKELEELVHAGLINRVPEYPGGQYVVDSKGKVEWVHETDLHWP